MGFRSPPTRLGLVLAVAMAVPPGVPAQAPIPAPDGASKVPPAAAAPAAVPAAPAGSQATASAPAAAPSASPAAPAGSQATASAPAADAAAPAPAAPTQATLAALLAASDEAYLRRDEPGQLQAVKDALDQAEKLAPDDFEVLWRIARYHFWTADAPGIDSEEKSRQGKLGWDYGDRAAKARPERVEGWFYGASGVGQYSLGISVVTALFRGMESKYTERLSRAQSIDASLNGYAADVAWGRYWFELPWPKYDSEKSEEAYRRALRANPNNLRAKVYLAELYHKEDRPKEAASLVAEVLAARPGAYDAPEERRAQQEARALLPKLER